MQLSSLKLKVKNVCLRNAERRDELGKVDRVDKVYEVDNVETNYNASKIFNTES